MGSGKKDKNESIWRAHSEQSHKGKKQNLSSDGNIGSWGTKRLKTQRWENVNQLNAYWMWSEGAETEEESLSERGGVGEGCHRNEMAGKREPGKSHEVRSCFLPNGKPHDQWWHLEQNLAAKEGKGSSGEAAGLAGNHQGSLGEWWASPLRGGSRGWDTGKTS